jgi:mannose-6-phosphate isomerase-like protein (cupin superfamily)
MSKMITRRNVLQTTTLAAASLPFQSLMQASAQPSGAGPVVAAAPYALVTGVELEKLQEQLKAAPGNHEILPMGTLPFSITLTTEKAKSGTQFEYHEDHDHIFLILDGMTVYEIGGTPMNGKNTKPNEWLAPNADGFKTLVLKKGDMLLIPRGTPHRRKTAESVTLVLIQTYGSLLKV